MPEVPRVVCGAIGAQSKADSLAFLSSQRTTPPTARGLPSGWFPGCTRGLGFPAYVCRQFRCAHVMRAGAMHCPLTHSVRMRVCYSTCPHCPSANISRSPCLFLPSCPRVKEEAGPLNKARLLPVCWILLPPAAARLLCPQLAHPFPSFNLSLSFHWLPSPPASMLVPPLAF